MRENGGKMEVTKREEFQMVDSRKQEGGPRDKK